jgi:hypothetical protein
VARYLSQLDTADRQEPSDVLVLKTTRLKEKLDKLKEEMGKLAAYEKQMLALPDGQISLADSDRRSMAWFRRRLLQSAGRGRHRKPSDRDARGHEYRLRIAHNLQMWRGKPRAFFKVDKLEAVADGGYFNGEEILACEQQTCV